MSSAAVSFDSVPLVAGALTPASSARTLAARGRPSDRAPRIEARVGSANSVATAAMSTSPPTPAYGSVVTMRPVCLRDASTVVEASGLVPGACPRAGSGRPAQRVADEVGQGMDALEVLT